MNRILLISICFFSVLMNPAQAQRRTTDAFGKGLIQADLSTSIGLYRNRNFLSTRIPVFAGVDYAVSNDVSLGVFGGWNQRTFKDANYPPYDRNYYYYGLRVGVHLTDWLNDNTMIKFDPSNVDIYVKGYAGRQVAKTLSITPGGLLGAGTVNIFGGYMGARIYTMHPVGIMVEFGAGPYGIFNLGICVKL